MVGAVGYTGAEVIRLLHGHPGIEVTQATSTRYQGESLANYCPWLATDLVLSDFQDIADVDLIFLCQDVEFGLNHAEHCASKAKVVDLSPAFRLTSSEKFESTYKLGWKGVYTYGLPEIGTREAVSQAAVVANPGCHASAALLGLVPLVQAGLINGTPVIDSKTGMSGAGRSKQHTPQLFSEHADNFYAYAPVGHRHIPEIEEHSGLKVRFTPHLLPVTRGILSTSYVPLKSTIAEDELLSVFAKHYAGEPFVRIASGPPMIKQVLGSNRCDIWATVDPETNYAVVISVLDNLVKGASGQAIQNANLMLGLPEDSGLPIHGVWP